MKKHMETRPTPKPIKTIAVKALAHSTPDFIMTTAYLHLPPQNAEKLTHSDVSP